MSLLTFDRVSLELGHQRLLQEAAFTVNPGERVCLIGRNGAGKSTLFKLISGELEPDSGEIRTRAGLRISQLRQTLPQEEDQSVYDYVAAGLAQLQQLIETYQTRSREKPDKHGLRDLEELQRRIEAGGGWHIDQRVRTVLSELDLPAEKTLTQLSGGWQRRVALARALVNQPDLLLLDEPTNHLDLSTIEWLENRVYAFPGSVMFVTHDRAFLQRLATRILELDRGRLSDWPYGYHKFLLEKENWLQAEARRHALFDKKLAQEEAWIRQGIKARRTRNEGRVRALKAMREVYARRIKPQNQARVHIEEAEQSGRKVIEARNISHGFGDELLIQGLSLKILRGDRIGLIGNNGVGKSTLLKILLGELPPQKGTVKAGTNLEIGYFDQTRRKLDPEQTVAGIVGDGAEYIKINGRDRHVIGYLKGFLFSPERAMTKIKVLSGGECNRVILARLLARPSNLLVLDEPTNDLDVETLEVLEERLCDYQGTLIVVSHDREFLDNVVTGVLVFEQGGKIRSYAGGYSDWLKQHKALAETDNPNKSKKAKVEGGAETPEKKNAGKLTYKLQRELDLLPAQIEELERAVDELHRQTGASDFYKQDYEKIQPLLDQLNEKQKELEAAMERWSELEAMQDQLASS